MRHPVIEEDLTQIGAAALPWEELKGKTVLVSGASGFLPAYMVETLLYLNESRNLGLRVLAMVRDLQKAKQRFDAYEGRQDLEYTVQDLGEPLRLERRSDMIVHAASLASPKFYGSDPVGTIKPNVLGTAALLDYARQCRSSRFLFFSGGETYGQLSPAEMPISESTPGRVDAMSLRSCYAESKRMGEAMCTAWHHQFGVPALVARIYHTYGPRMRLDDGRVYADLVADILAGRDLVLKSDGSAVRIFCYLADATLAFFTLLLRGEAGRAYNVADPDGEMSILQLAEKLVALFPEKKLKVLRQVETGASSPPPSGISRSLPDVGKLLGLGWKPKTSPDEGFLRTVRSFQ